jgi:aspartate racemase
VEDSRNEYKQIIKALIVQGAQGIILGCTEIELLIKQNDSNVPLFPTSAIHAIAAVEKALENS